MTIVTLHEKRVFKSGPVEKPAEEQTNSKAQEEAGARALLVAQCLGSTAIRAEQAPGSGALIDCCTACSRG
ncbi:hypothetical protein A4R35_04900 [Thermogemmatispora tikiterensis]|uniref:Uncharacterized protein n=1 Tax=Thermogemmatispora tikiterensis TaxID=1825093 RepID=A0A328VIG8_9CHLR|nr:hypothetical protein A4R35_04900 [Thermogemmatispora tikiterensis]